MAASKNGASLLANVATTQTSAATDVSGDYADTVFIRLTQTGTATTAAQAQVYEQPHGSSNWYAPATGYVVAGLAPGNYDFPVQLDPTTVSVKVTYAQQAGGTSSACTAELGQLQG